MANNDKLEMTGTVTKVLRGTTYEVTLDDVNKVIVCKISGKLRVNNISILQNDRVTVQISPYDLTKGIITWRGKKK
jgi:translation initiation factor IF-1